MSGNMPASSARRNELLEAAYQYALEHGLADLSLRPLAAAVGSSPRVLLYLFGSKDDLIRALLARARLDELAMLAEVRPIEGERPLPLVRAAEQVWAWLAAAEHQPLLQLWVEGYARSLVDPDGPWAGFAKSTVEDWLAVLTASQRTEAHRAPDGPLPTIVLAVLRGALLDLLATGETTRTTAAVHQYLSTMQPAREPGHETVRCGHHGEEIEPAPDSNRADVDSKLSTAATQARKAKDFESEGKRANAIR